MIKIIYDPEKLVNGQKATLLVSSVQYPHYFFEISKAIQSGQDYILLIRQPTAVSWLKNMSSRYPQDTFTFEDIDARGALSQRWQVEIPNYVSNEEIIDTDLFSLDFHPQPGFTFDDALLAYFYSPLIVSKKFPFSQIAQLIQASEVKTWKENNKKPLLVKIYHQRLEEWEKNASSSEQRGVIQEFAENPEALKVQLMKFKVLSSYPSIGETLQSKSFNIYKSLKLPLYDLDINEIQIKDVIDQVTYYLNSLHPISIEELKGLIKTNSGLLMIEFDFVEKHLRDHAEWISNELLDHLDVKFESIYSKVARRIKALRQLIHPLKPEKPNMDWDINQMLNWATQCYLPYQAWCSAQEKFDQELFSIGDHFSEWLVSHWSDLHANSERMIFNILPNLANLLKDPQRVNLVVVVDNLGWSFAEALVDLFKARTYFHIKTEPYLAMVPTETEISKKCLLSGAVGYTKIDEKGYKKIIEKGWVPYFNNRAFRYISDIGGLNKIENIDASTYVVNYLAVDKALHKSSNEIGMAHTEHISHLLEKLVDNIEDFVEKHNLKEKIYIHIVSDHGSTRIPKSIQNELDPNFFITNGFEIKSQRYIKVNNELFNNLADNLKTDCFFLQANDYLNAGNYLCARRANRFLPVDMDIYVHGGLLPEEVIVPYITFERSAISIEEPSILLKRNEFRYRIEIIRLEIGNPNEAALDQIRIGILNNNVESEPILIRYLKGKTNSKVEINARFNKTPIVEDQTKLHLRIRYICKGEDCSFDAYPEIMMRKIVDDDKSALFDV